MKKNSFIVRLSVLTAILIAAFSLPNPVFSNGVTTQIVVNPVDAAVQTCSDLTIAIRVEDVTDLTGYHLEISFDPAAIQVTEVVNGGFLDGAADAAFYEPTNAVDNVNGTILFGMAQQNSIADPMTPKSGSGDLILITLEAVSWNMDTEITIDSGSSMLVDWPNAFEIPFSAINGTVSTQSCAPTDLELSKADIPENEPVGTLVGLLASTDPDSGDIFTYSLVDDANFPGNLSFQVDGERLETAVILNFEVQSAYMVLIRTTDLGGKYFDKEFNIQVTDVNDPPVAFSQEVVTTEDEPVTFTIAGYDEDGGDFSFNLVTPPSHGVMPWTPPELTYSPDYGFEGVDSFTFTVTDEHSAISNTATVNIVANPKATIDYFFPIFMYQSGK